MSTSFIKISNILRVTVSLFLIGSYFSCQEKQKEDDYHTIIPAVGYDNFKIGITTLEDIVKVNGSNYKMDTFYRQTNRNTPNKGKKEIYSIGACYDHLGVRFFFHPGEKKIFSIVFRPPFKGKTNKGIKLNESTFKEIKESYGNSDWGFGPNRMSLNYGGIWFVQTSKCTYESSQEEINACLLNKATQIEIAKPDE